MSLRVYDARRFGAYGDGSTNDTAAIQAAITAAKAAKGTIFFPPGVYKVAGTLLMDGGTDVAFAGKGATLQQFTAETTTLKLNDVSRVTVDGLRFVGLGTETPWGGGAWNNVGAIWVVGSDDVILNKNLITNHAGGSVRYTGVNNRLAITGNTIDGMGSGSISAGQHGHDFAIGGFATTCNGLILTDNQISGHAFGIYAGYGDTGIISNNIIKNIPGQHAMYLQPGQRLVVNGNSIYDCGNAGIKIGVDDPADFVRSVTISGNNIEKVGTMGIVVTVQSAGLPYNVANISLTNNHIVESQYGMYLYGTTNVHASGNRIRTCTEQGIVLREGSGYFKNTVIKSCYGAGFWSREPRGDITLSGMDVIDAPTNPNGLTGSNYAYLRSIYLNDAVDNTVHTVFLDGIRCWYEDEAPKAGVTNFCIGSLDYNRLVIGTIVNDTGVGHSFAGTAITPVRQPAPAVIANGNTALTTLNLQAKILTMVSATSPAAPTVPTGTAINAVIGIEDAIDWSFQNKGDQTVTITAADGHTLSGGMAISAGTQKQFRTTCTAANVAVTYALS